MPVATIMRTFTQQHKVLNHEGDAWGQLQPSGVLRLLETSAIDAAADGGYGDEFHAAHGTAWVVRRITLLLLAPAHTGEILRSISGPPISCACAVVANTA